MEAIIMVAVSKKYVKRKELMSTIEAMLKTYSHIHIKFPSNVEEHFLVKAWGKREKKRVVEYGSC